VSAASLRQSPYVRWVIRTIGVERVVALVGLLQLPFLTLLGAVVRRLPRDPRIVALGAPLDRFADNSAYLFLHMSTSCPDLEPVWISGSPKVVAELRERGLAAELRWSRAGIQTCLRAGSFVYSGYRSDINQLLAPGAITVALWHGVGIKRVGGGVHGEAAPAKRTLMTRLAEAGKEPPADYFLSSTDFVTHEIFSPAFGTPPERCWELGYPRNDHIATGTAAPDALVTSPELAERLAAADKVVGVFLTWRGDRVDDAIDEDLLLRLAALCRRHGGVLAYKAHYNMQPTAVLVENCVLLPATADLNAYLGHCDVLVTDYSSVAADFLLMRKPAVFFMPDLDEYAERPGFYFPAERFPGTLTQDREALLRAVEQTLSGGPNHHTWSSEDEEFIQMLWGDYSGHACTTVAEAITAAASKGRQPMADSTQRGSLISSRTPPK
jgi:CDP-glycerol glycerophosphotransferase (TagB/SpsB family)